MTMAQDPSGEFRTIDSSVFALGTDITDVMEDIATNSNTLIARKPYPLGNWVRPSGMTALTLGTSYEEVYSLPVFIPDPAIRVQAAVYVTFTNSAEVTLQAVSDVDTNTAIRATTVSMTRTLITCVMAIGGSSGGDDLLKLNIKGNSVSADVLIDRIEVFIVPVTTAIPPLPDLYAQFVAQVNASFTDDEPLTVRNIRELTLNNNTIYANAPRIVGTYYMMGSDASLNENITDAPGTGTGIWATIDEMFYYKRDPSAQYLDVKLAGYTEDYTDGAGARILVGFKGGGSGFQLGQLFTHLDTATRPTTLANFQLNNLIKIPPGPGPHILFIHGQTEAATDNPGVVTEYCIREV